MADAQNLKNHARFVPLYHFVLALLLAVFTIHAFRALMQYTPERLYTAILALALLLMALYLRVFPLAVQDRVIRLEMRLRVQQLAPALAPRFDELALGQVVALRFAGDDELASLMQQVLDRKLVRPADIKAAVKHWRADSARA